MGIFLAGFAEIDITPPPGCELTGYAVADRIATGTHDPLKAVAVVLDDRRQKSVLCAVDLCVIHAEVIAVVKKRVSKRTAIPPERITIAATHTHSGPKLMNSSVLANQQWVRTLEDRLTEAMMLADYHRKPARVAIGAEAAEGIGGNRRTPDGPVDDSVQVLRVESERDNACMGAIVNVALHPTVLGPDNREYSADFVGVLRDEMTRLHGCDLPVVCFNGACGDVNPGGYSPEASLRGEIAGERTFERAQQIGEAYGRAAYAAFGAAVAQPDPSIQADAASFSVRLRRFPLPAEAAATRDIAASSLASASPGSDAERDARAELIYAEQLCRNAEIHASSVDGELEMTLQAVSIAGWSLLALPVELMAQPGLDLRANSGFRQTMVAAYANGSMGYLPAAEADGGYEDRTALFGDWAVEIVLSQAGALLAVLAARQEQAACPPVCGQTEPVIRPELVLEHTEVEAACVPAIDFHLHWWSHWFSFEEIIERMNRANVALGVTLVGDVFPGCRLEPVLELMEPVKDRFFYLTAVDFAKIDDPDWRDYVYQKLQHDVELGAKGIKLYKDLGLGYVDRRGQRLRATDPRVKVLWDAAAEMELPVLYHVADPPAFFDPIVPENERYDQLRGSQKWWWGRPGYPGFDELIDEMFELVAQNRKTTFIFPHVASLSNDLRRAGQLIEAGDNVYVDLSARLPQLARQPYRGREFCTTYADRVLFGTDDTLPGRNDVYQLWFRLLETRDEYFSGDYYGARVPWRFYGLDLPQDCLAKIYRDNAARLLGLDPAAVSLPNTSRGVSS